MCQILFFELVSKKGGGSVAMMQICFCYAKMLTDKDDNSARWGKRKKKSALLY